jgi:hypothetical protein
MEEEVRTLQRQFGGMVQMMKELKTSFNVLENKVLLKENDEIQKILETQKAIEESLASNQEAIKRIEEEMKEFAEKNVDITATHKVPDNTGNDAGEIAKTRLCRYYNRGYCKYKFKCKYIHPKEICIKHIQNGNCRNKECEDRHPKTCKWTETELGCRRPNCEYLHVTLAHDDGQENEAHKSFPCYGCKNIFNDATCVVKHKVENTVFSLCLNCDDWIVFKDKILYPGWSLFDQNGDLRRDV